MKLRRILVQLFIATAVLLLPVLVFAEPIQSVGGGADVVISVIDNRKTVQKESRLAYACFCKFRHRAFKAIA